MRKIVGLLLIFGFGFYLVTIIGPVVFPSSTGEKASVGVEVLKNEVAEVGAANTVTSVVVLYRGFDTLGEVTVLFLAALGLTLLMKGEKHLQAKLFDESFILKTGSYLLFPFMILFGMYIIVHGHLTPGGGFPGGVIIATGYFIIVMTSDVVRLREGLVSFLEGLAGLTFIGLGLVGLFKPADSFLFNFLSKGTFNTLLSAGIIPFIYAAIGIKVGSELTGAVGNMFFSPYGRQKDA
ncbi:MAG: cation:proton antiporter [Spirochaetes bacterium]|nr:MAG: cation:proton antiporter [Spirochaetota bacterium]